MAHDFEHHLPGASGGLLRALPDFAEEVTQIVEGTAGRLAQSPPLGFEARVSAHWSPPRGVGRKRPRQGVVVLAVAGGAGRRWAFRTGHRTWAYSSPR